MVNSIDCVTYNQNSPDKEFGTKRDKTNPILCKCHKTLRVFNLGLNLKDVSL